MIKHSKSQNKPSSFKNINQNDMMQQSNYDNRGKQEPGDYWNTGKNFKMTNYTNKCGIVPFCCYMFKL